MKKNFAPPWKNVLDIVWKSWSPLCKLFASSGVPIWLGPASYACYSSTVTLISKIIKQTIDNLFQFDLDKSQNYLWKDTFAPVVHLFKSQGGNTTALRRPCLPLSAITASLHYLPRCLRSRVTCDKTPNVVTQGWGTCGQGRPYTDAAALGPAPWCLGGLFIIARYTLPWEFSGNTI